MTHAAIHTIRTRLSSGPRPTTQPGYHIPALNQSLPITPRTAPPCPQCGSSNTAHVKGWEWGCRTCNHRFEGGCYLRGQPSWWDEPQLVSSAPVPQPIRTKAQKKKAFNPPFPPKPTPAPKPEPLLEAPIVVPIPPKPTPQQWPQSSQRYYRSRLGVVGVESYSGKGKLWCSFRHNAKGNPVRFQSNRLPLRNTALEAQTDLDLYAQRIGYEEVSP